MISPGGVMVMLMMPLVGFLAGRVDPRYLVAFGFAMLGCRARPYAQSRLRYPATSTSHGCGSFRPAGLAFLFVPINMLSYTDVPREKNNDVSGLDQPGPQHWRQRWYIVFRHRLARRSQFHQSRLTTHLTDLDMIFRQRVEAIANLLTHVGGRTPSMAQAREMAQASLYRQLATQSAVLAYLDVIFVLAVGSACMIPLVFFMKKRAAGKGEIAMH